VTTNRCNHNLDPEDCASCLLFERQGHDLQDGWQACHTIQPGTENMTASIARTCGRCGGDRLFPVPFTHGRQEA
jgi:hypothetical protein